MADLSVLTQNSLVLVVGQKDQKSRLKKYADWLDLCDQLDPRPSPAWLRPDLAVYRDYLLSVGLAHESVSSHLSTIRARYESLTRKRDMLFAVVDEFNPGLTFEQRQAWVEEIKQRILDAMHPKEAPVTVVKEQDESDFNRIRLTANEANRLVRAPGTDTLHGLRDTAMIALMLATGIREAELCALEVSDLRHTLSGELSLYVKRGKGAKMRLVPYGELDDVLVLVDAWLDKAGVRSGPVFRPLTPRGDKVDLTNGGITTRTVERMMERYPISVGGRMTRLTPHDLRATYAKLMFLAGQDPNGIKDNMGHSSIKMTFRYIGPIDIHLRRAKSVYNFSGIITL